MPLGPLLGIKPTQARCIELVLAQLQVAGAEALEALGLTCWIGHCQLVVHRPKSIDVESPQLKSVLPILDLELSCC
jgi:hypothetical protein